MSEIDFGARCETHVGEVFPPRCADCAALSHALAAETNMPPAALPVARTTDECPTHPNYPEPCARCARDRSTPHGETPMPEDQEELIRRFNQQLDSNAHVNIYNDEELGKISVDLVDAISRMETMEEVTDAVRDEVLKYSTPVALQMLGDTASCYAFWIANRCDQAMFKKHLSYLTAAIVGGRLALNARHDDGPTE